jgi:hypothetical protein
LPAPEPLAFELLIYSDRIAVRAEGDESETEIESKPRTFAGPLAHLKALASRVSTDGRRFYVRLRETTDGRSRIGVQMREGGRTRATTFGRGRRRAALHRVERAS